MNRPAAGILFSYHFARTIVDRCDAMFRSLSQAGWPVLIDSGAFSAWRLNKPIDLDAYCDWVRPRRPWFTGGFIALDVLADRAATMDNLNKMVDRGLSPIPVLTADMPIQQVSQLAELTGNDDLCVAGGVNWPLEPMVARFRLVELERPASRVHGLGFTRNNWPWRAPMFSCDSSSWNTGTQFGHFATFEPVNGVHAIPWTKVRERGFRMLTPHQLRVVQSSGINASNVNDKMVSRTHGSWLNLCGVVAWLQFAEHLAERGRRCYLATVEPQVLTMLGAAQLTRLPGGGCRYPDCTIEYLRLRRVYKQDPSSFWRYLTNDIDWTKR